MGRKFSGYHEQALKDYFGPLAALVAGCSPDGVTLQNAARGASGKGHRWTVHARPWSDSDGNGDELVAWARVDRALSHLPPGQRAALELAYSYEYPSADAYHIDAFYARAPGDKDAAPRAAPPRPLAALAKATPEEFAAIVTLTNAARAAFAEAYQ